MTSHCATSVIEDSTDDFELNILKDMGKSLNFDDYLDRDDWLEGKVLRGGQLTDMAISLDSLLALNSSTAGIMAKCSYDGSEYTIEMDYYIWDWYDYSPYLKEDLYSLNTFGYAKSYEVIGKTHKKISWK